jgi:hypothetical protein
VPNGTTEGSSRSQDLEPAEEPGNMGIAGSQLREPALAPEPQDGSQLSKLTLGPADQEVNRSQLLDPIPGLTYQDATRSQLLEAASGPEGQEPLGLEPMEINALDPPAPFGRVRSIQRSVYYTNEVLHDAKTTYLEAHNVLYEVLITSRKLCRYFKAHKISVVTSYPLKVVLHNPNATGNIAKWAAGLDEFQMDFIPCHTVTS